MTGDAGGLSIMQFMTTDTTVHRRHAFDVRHGLHLANVTVAHLTFHASVQMRAMIPRRSREDGIHPHPRHCCFRFLISRELLNTRLIFRDRGMTCHARGSIRERHQISRIRVPVTALALQTQRQMSFVAIGKRLRGRSRWHRSIVYVLTHGLR
jgi:hypothetical protein